MAITAGRPPARLSLPSITRGSFWFQLAGLTVAAFAASAAGLWPLWQRAPVLGLANTLLATTFLAIGFVLVAEPGQSPPGVALMVSAVLLVVSWSNEWLVFPWPLVSGLGGNLWFLAAGWALYRYPDRALSAADRRVFTGLLVWIVVTPWVEDAVSRPEWHAYPAGDWWPTLHADRLLADRVGLVIQVGDVALLVIYVALWIGKLRIARPAVRRVRLPTAVAAVVAALFGAAVPVGGLLAESPFVADFLSTVSTFGVLVVPAAFGISVLRRLFERTSVADLVTELQGIPTPELVMTNLRKALHDPGLEVAYWSVPQQKYLIDARPLSEDWAHGDVLVHDVTSSQGEPLARIRVDEASVRDGRLVASTIAAFQLVLERALLLERTQQGLRQLQAASIRVVAAADAERDRIERNLHDGAQGRFLSVGLLVGLLEASTSDPDTLSAISEIRSELEAALQELRNLAHGLDPGLLRLGLTRAIQDLATGAPYRVNITLPSGPLPETVVRTVYYLVAEALTNITKHAQASSASVVGRIREGILELVVEDDGRGGATVHGEKGRQGVQIGQGGHGLSGMADRVTAVGGRMSVESPPGGGTRVTLWLPCE